MSDEIVLFEGKVFFLYFGEFVLVIIYELVILLDNIVGWLDGCFLLVRLGLMVYVIVYRIDSGWVGNIVLEFYNSGKLFLVLKFKMKIGVLSFEVLLNLVEKFYNVCVDVKYKG